MQWQHQPAKKLAVFGDIHLCAGCLRHLDAVTCHQFFVAAEDLSAIYHSADAMAGDLFYRFWLRKRPFSGGRQNTRGDGVGGMLFTGGAEGQNILAAHDLLHGKIALGNCTGLIQHHCLYRGQRL